jgi:hypothetical protein
MNTQTPSRTEAPLTLRDLVDAMPIVILARAVASALANRDRGDFGRRTPAAWTA